MNEFFFLNNSFSIQKCDFPETVNPQKFNKVTQLILRPSSSHTSTEVLWTQVSELKYILQEMKTVMRPLEGSKIQSDQTH